MMINKINNIKSFLINLRNVLYKIKCQKKKKY